MARSFGPKAPAVMLAATIVGASYAVYYAHHQQIAEKQVMRAGVIRDIKRDRLKQRAFQEQQQQQHDSQQQQQQ